MNQSARMHFSLPYCLLSHIATAWTEMEWVNSYWNHSHTSIQVICETVNWISIRGYITHNPVLPHIYDKKRPWEKKKKQLHSRRSNGTIWSCLLCGSKNPPTERSKAIWALAQGISVIQQKPKSRDCGADAKVLLSKTVSTVSFNR